MHEGTNKKCPRCGARFNCRAPQACWCAELPPLEAAQPEGDCLCPDCLGQAIASERALRRVEQVLSNTKKPPAAFTLIELLVSIGVISILSALLLPALHGGKAAAQSAQCTSNLRQFVLAGQMYWDENQGNPFPYSNLDATNGVYYWFGWLGPGAEETRAFDPTSSPLYPWLATGVEICPSFDYTSSLFKLKAAAHTCDYGYNAAIYTGPLNMRKIPAPTRLAFLADAAQVNTFQSPASAKHPMFEEWYYIDNEVGQPNPQPNAQFRHQQRANVVFVDGHVTPQAMAPGSLDPRLPYETIGSLPQNILQP